MYARKEAGVQTLSMIIFIVTALAFLTYLLVLAYRDGSLHYLRQRVLQRPTYE
jgi:ABC-type lipoprotein release transport system permease subunit